MIHLLNLNSICILNGNFLKNHYKYTIKYTGKTCTESFQISKISFSFFWILIRILYVRLSLELFFSNKLPTTCFLQKCTIAGSLKISTWFFLFNECKDALWMCISTDFDVNDNLSFSCDIHDKRWNNNIVLQLVAFVKSLHMTRLH